MKPATRVLAAASVSFALLLGGAVAAMAEVVDWTVAAVTTGFLPDPEPLVTHRVPAIDPEPGFPFSFDIQASAYDPTIKTATAELTLASNAPGTEQSKGTATVTVDPVLSIGSSSAVYAGDMLFPAGCGCSEMANGSIAALNATIANPLGGGATVDLMLHVTGSLVLQNVTGAGAFEDCFDDSCEIVSDVSASVSILLALADVIDLDSFDLFLLPEDLPVLPLFSGSLLLELRPLTDEAGEPLRDESGEFVGFKPVILSEGDFDAHGPFDPSGPCTLEFCKVDVTLDLAFTNVQALGFGDVFEIGLLMTTSADGPAVEGRRIEADFAHTASVELAFVPSAQAPAPASFLIVIAGLLGMTATRRRRTLR